MIKKMLNILERKIRNKSFFDFETNFPPLGHPEHHFNKYPNHPWLKNEEEIRCAVLNLIKNSNADDYFVINDDLTVSFNKWTSIALDKNALKRHEGYLPIQIRSCKSDFKADKVGLKKIVGTPYVAQSLSLRNNKIESLFGLSGNIKKMIFIENNPIKNFYGMPEKIKSSSISISYNTIKSWEGFTNIKSVFLKGNENQEVNDDMYEFLLNVPDRVDGIVLSNVKTDSRIKVSEGTVGALYVNMSWLRCCKKSKNTNKNKNKKHK